MKAWREVLVTMCAALSAVGLLTSCGEAKKSPYAPEKDFTFENGVIMGYTGPGGEIHIPPKIKKKDVTAIGKGAFMKSGELTAVYLPEGVTEIGDDAFRLCGKLSTVDFSQVQKIGSNAFLNCPYLRDVHLPETCTEIGKNSFQLYSQSGGVKTDNGKLFIPKSLTAIPDEAFSCTRFVTVEFESETLPSFGEKAFSDTGDITVVMPQTVKPENAEVLKEAFAKAGGFTNIKLAYPDGKEIKVVYEDFSDRYQFNQTDDAVTIISYIGKESDVTVPAKIGGKKVVSILDDAFREKAGLKTLTISEGIEKLGVSICYQCPDLEKVSLPDSVTEVGDMFCHECPKLKEVKWSAGADIPKQAFDSCKALTSFTVPDGVKAIGENAFDGCSALKTVSLGKVETLGQMAFDGCGLEEITVPGTVKEIPYCCFTKCLYVKKIRLLSGVESIGDSAFYLCGAGTKTGKDRPQWIVAVTDPSKYSEIVRDDRENPSFLDIYLPGTLKKVAHGAFSDTYISGLYMTDVKKPEELPVFEPGAFSGIHFFLQVYFDKAVIDDCGTELDNYFKQIPEIGDRCWYDEGKHYYWAKAQLPEDAE